MEALEGRGRVHDVAGGKDIDTGSQVLAIITTVIYTLVTHWRHCNGVPRWLLGKVAGESCWKDTELKARSTEGGESWCGGVAAQRCVQIWTDRRIDLECVVFIALGEAMQIVFHSSVFALSGCLERTFCRKNLV